MNVMEMRLADIVPYAKNAKKHDKKQIDNVAESIRQYGFVQPIVVDTDGVIVIGHCRALAAKKLGMDTVPCVCVDDLTPEQVKALRLVDNKTNESEWDLNVLSEELVGLSLEDFELAWGIGEDYAPEDFGDSFALADGDKSEFCTMTFTLHNKQKELIDYAMGVTNGQCEETFGNANKNGNALYEVVRQWADARR